MDVATLQQENHILFMISVFRNLMFKKVNEKQNQESVKISRKQPQTSDSVVISCSVSNTEKVAWILLFFYLPEVIKYRIPQLVNHQSYAIT